MIHDDCQCVCVWCERDLFKAEIQKSDEENEALRKRVSELDAILKSQNATMIRWCDALKIYADRAHWSKVYPSDAFEDFWYRVDDDYNVLDGHGYTLARRVLDGGEP